MSEFEIDCEIAKRTIYTLCMHTQDYPILMLITGLRSNCTHIHTRTRTRTHTHAHTHTHARTHAHQVHAHVVQQAVQSRVPEIIRLGEHLPGDVKERTSSPIATHISGLGIMGLEFPLTDVICYLFRHRPQVSVRARLRRLQNISSEQVNPCVCSSAGIARMFLAHLCRVSRLV